MVKALGELFLWSFKEKASAVSRDTAFSLGSVIYVVVSSLQHGENTAFSPVFPLVGFMAEVFCWLFPWNVIEKGINLFLWHSLSLWASACWGYEVSETRSHPLYGGGIICGTVIERECYTVQWIESFLWVFSVALWLRHLIDFLLRTPRLCRHFYM